MATDDKISKVQELFYEIRVSDVMTSDVITVSPDTPISRLRRILKEKRISGVPVVDNGKLVGIVSIEDYIQWLTEHRPDCPIGEMMTLEVRTLYADEHLVQAVNRFERLGFGRFVVVDRNTEKLVGIITKGNIIEGLLKKLEVSLEEEEELYARRVRHFFEDILADKVVLLFEYDIIGKDFKRAGEGASRLKTTLLRLGLDPQIVRRVAVATYEAEMNLVIYTDGGKIRVSVEPHEIFVRVEDSGPGIPDIDKALEPGYSTAPDWVRDLGFGAGMGLYNIQKCASKMELNSTVGKGTQLHIHISTEIGAYGEAERAG
jgi:CBS domain-containing protein/anti-sigma regulatory factor (Ser/Thr protein kinase)